MLSARARIMASCLALACGAMTAGAARAEQNIYRLGPQDRLDVRVFDLRNGSGEAHPWVALNGVFVVDAAGAVSLPLLGEIPAGGGTTGDLAHTIAARLQAKIGLAQLPDASVQVIKYRPFYIMGAVDKPGEYDYRPGLSVLQAVSTAGGLGRAGDDSLLGYERDALGQRGELRLLATERVALLTRQARLDAEISGAASIAIADEIKARSSDPDVARALREEQLLFDSRRSSLASQIDALRQAKSLLQSQLSALTAKESTLDHQLDLTRKELSQVSDLVTKGLAVVPRQLAAEQSAASFESSRLDVALARFRAQQDLAKIDQDAIALRAKRRDEALIEAADVRARLAAGSEKTDTAEALVYQSEVRAPLALAQGEVERQPTYRLTHNTEGVSQTRSVGESEFVEPGDVLRVVLPRRTSPGSARNAAAPLPAGEAADASPGRPQP